MSMPRFEEALRVLSQDAGGDVHRALAVACESLPAWDPAVYLADFSCQMLLPLTAGLAGEDVAATLAGRAFVTGQPVISRRDDAVRIWVPVMEQTSRTGVLALTVPEAGDELLARAKLLGVFAGLVIAMSARVSDVPHLRRCCDELSLPASMQWELLPPLSARIAGALVAGLLEPAYDVAGDAFDYATSDGDLHFAVMDGMGHGLSSTVLTGLAVGAYRHARRNGASVSGMHAAVNEALVSYYDDLSFATGVVARLSTESGRLEWTCAGHPRPLLLRGRKVVAELDVDSGLPFGLGGGVPEPGTCDLEPGDGVLLYTDGITEARTPDGQEFGLERLTDLVEREAAGELGAEELLRRLVHAVLAHQGGDLRDDATLLLVQWSGPASRGDRDGQF